MSSFLSAVSRGVSRDVRSQFGQRARRCARKYVPRSNVRRCLRPALWSALCTRFTDTRTYTRSPRTHAPPTHTHTRYNRTPQTRTYVHTRPSRATRERERELKGRDPNHFPKLLVDASIDVSLPVAGRAIESPAVQRGRLRSLKHTQPADLSIGLYRFDSDLTRGQILSPSLRFNCRAFTLVKCRELSATGFAFTHFYAG